LDPAVEQQDVCGRRGEASQQLIREHVQRPEFRDRNDRAAGSGKHGNVIGAVRELLVERRELPAPRGVELRAEPAGKVADNVADDAQLSRYGGLWCVAGEQRGAKRGLQPGCGRSQAPGPARCLDRR
jgi:hypothetical protein